MKKIIVIFNAILLLTTILTSCKKDNVKCTGDTEFCASVNKEEYNNTGAIIDKYLSGQKESLSDNEKLEQLRDWLKCKSCVSNAEILCNSCIYTNPAQSELIVLFIVNGQQVEKVLDVIMSKPLKFRTFHD
jgi:hypothetical protein